jgi:NAD+ synthetase
MNRTALTLSLIILGFAACAAYLTLFTVSQTQQALLLEFGKPKRVITEAGLPLTVMMLPDGYRPESDSIVTARQMVDWLQIPAPKVQLFDLKPVLDARCGVCPMNPCSTEERKYCRGNRAARQRMVELFDLARRIGGVVSGTENFSEYLTGYFTLHGDEASNVEPIHGLT